MSSSLVWKPIEYKDYPGLDTGLKWILQKHYGSPVNVILNSSDIGYFQGLMDAGTKDADTIIAAIQKHHEIKTWEEF